MIVNRLHGETRKRSNGRAAQKRGISGRPSIAPGTGGRASREVLHQLKYGGAGADLVVGTRAGRADAAVGKKRANEPPSDQAGPRPSPHRRLAKKKRYALAPPGKHTVRLN